MLHVSRLACAKKNPSKHCLVTPVSRLYFSCRVKCNYGNEVVTYIAEGALREQVKNFNLKTC